MVEDSVWVGGRFDAVEALNKAKESLAAFDALRSRMACMSQDTDALIHRISSLISIDEGYRSRDQNTSIWRLSWVTVSFYASIQSAMLCMTKYGKVRLSSTSLYSSTYIHALSTSPKLPSYTNPRVSSE